MKLDRLDFRVLHCWLAGFENPAYPCIIIRIDETFLSRQAGMIGKLNITLI
jgi:hypothetical protein